MLDIALDMEDIEANNPDKNSIFMELVFCEGVQIMSRRSK